MKESKTLSALLLLIFFAGMLLGALLEILWFLYEFDKDFNFSKGAAQYIIEKHPEIMYDLLNIYDPYCYVNRTIIFPNATIGSFTFPACWDRTKCDFNGSYTCVAIDLIVNGTKVNGTMYCSCNASKVIEWLKEHNAW